MKLELTYRLDPLRGATDMAWSVQPTEHDVRGLHQLLDDAAQRLAADPLCLPLDVAAFVRHTRASLHDIATKLLADITQLAQKRVQNEAASAAKAPANDGGLAAVQRSEKEST